MPEAVAGHPDYPVARHLQFGVAFAVILERLNAGVVRSAVEFDHDLLVRPGAVDAKTSDHDIELWRVDVAFAAEIDEIVFERRARIRRVAVQLGEGLSKCGRALTALAPGEQLFNRPQVEDSALLGLLDRLDQLVLAHHSRKVKKGARDARNRDAFPDRPVGTRQLTREVHCDALDSRLPAARDGDVNR